MTSKRDARCRVCVLGQISPADESMAGRNATMAKKTSANARKGCVLRVRGRALDEQSERWLAYFAFTSTGKTLLLNDEDRARRGRRSLPRRVVVGRNRAVKRLVVIETAVFPSHIGGKGTPSDTREYTARISHTVQEPRSSSFIERHVNTSCTRYRACMMEQSADVLRWR